ncbi:hypothetical protein LTR05_004476 [Lithohypha guttulata]|uniref:Uncharacterized protein n=1 Tax=Lithohypha guttulata TaxID=1690604 RepID=A0AAN7Y6E4_9EURO|nr:hypothetical protein LTR05_004476 [Lithohypha guttulata]
MELLNLPAELLNIIFGFVYEPWHLEIKLRDDTETDDYYEEPRILGVPHLPYLTPLLTCATFLHLASPRIIGSFTGLIDAHEAPLMDELPKRWQFLTPYVTTFYLSHAQPSGRYPQNCRFIRSLPHLKVVESFENSADSHIVQRGSPRVLHLNDIPDTYFLEHAGGWLGLPLDLAARKEMRVFVHKFYSWQNLREPIEQLGDRSSAVNGPRFEPLMVKQTTIPGAKGRRPQIAHALYSSRDASYLRQEHADVAYGLDGDGITHVEARVPIGLLLRGTDIRRQIAVSRHIINQAALAEEIAYSDKLRQRTWSMDGTSGTTGSSDPEHIARMAQWRQYLWTVRLASSDGDYVNRPVNRG